MEHVPNTISPEKIKENYDRFEALCQKLGDRSEPVAKMLADVGDSLALCPASGRLDFHLAVPGGLVQHSLSVLANAMKLCKAFDHDLPKDSLIVSALFHDFGKCGMVDDAGKVLDYYTVQDSSWHREKLGEMYKHNQDLPYMTVPHRGVWMLQRYGIRLSLDEWTAIVLNDGWVLQENKAYCLKESLLAHVIMTADYISTYNEKEEYKRSLKVKAIAK